jgi:hypothetical protein
MWILWTIIVLCICLWFFWFMMQDLWIVDNQNNVNIEEKIPTWTYQDKIDEMDSKVTHFAILSSTNKAYFSFPYSGGSTFILNIRNNWKNEVLLRVSKWQFSSNYWKTIKIKFDDLEPFTVNFNEPSDGSSDLVFLWSAEKIINWIKTAKIMKIEAEFFQEGEHIAEFLVEWLEWNY